MLQRRLVVFMRFYLTDPHSSFVSLVPDASVSVVGVAGATSRLPCNMSLASGDAVFLVLWFREGLSTPIYR